MGLARVEAHGVPTAADDTDAYHEYASAAFAVPRCSVRIDLASSAAIHAPSRCEFVSRHPGAGVLRRERRPEFRWRPLDFVFKMGQLIILEVNALAGDTGSR
jgi:hypothetical protein